MYTLQVSWELLRCGAGAWLQWQRQLHRSTCTGVLMRPTGGLCDSGVHYSSVDAALVGAGVAAAAKI
jgi:hypothetical protein